MPPLPRLRVSALRELEAQLRFASRDALKRDLERAELLADDIQPGDIYREDWLISRITGYTPSQLSDDSPAEIPGDAVLADLSAFVERLSDAAEILMEDVEDGVGVEELARKWSVSRKTIDRYRRSGLIARRVLDENGRARLMFTRRSIERFESIQHQRRARASSFQRMDDNLREQIIRRARVYRVRFGWSLNETAKRLSERFDRSHEAVRQVLRKHDATSQTPIFGERGPMSSRERRLAFRGQRRGYDTSELASWLGRAAPTIRRGIAIRRLELLNTLDLDGAGLPPRLDDLETQLASDIVRERLGEPGDTELVRFIDRARSGGAPIGAEETARASTIQMLLSRARIMRDGMSTSTPNAVALDRIETDLRWAARLMTELMRSQLPGLVRTLEARLGRSLDRVRATELGLLLTDSLRAMADAVMTFDPSSSGRLAARTGLSIDRAVQQWIKTHSSETQTKRASPKLVEGYRMPDWTRRVAPWQAWLDLPMRISEVPKELPESDAALLCARFGIGEPPKTSEEICELLSIRRVTLPRMESAAMRSLRAAVLAKNSITPG